METNPTEPIRPSALNPEGKPPGAEEAREQAKLYRDLVAHLEPLLNNKDFQWLWDRFGERVKFLHDGALELKNSESDRTAMLHRYRELDAFFRWPKETYVTAMKELQKMGAAS